MIDTIRKAENSVKVTDIWVNLIKYTTYPFAAAGIIGVALFLLDVGVDIPGLFSLFLLFVFLTMNSFYTTIKIAEKLVNHNYEEDTKKRSD